MVLYHAVSSFQIFMVAVHRMKFHSCERAILILPDFIIEKHPKIERLKLVFDEIILFPYTLIEHNEQNILTKTKFYYKQVVPYHLGEFKKIYIAGAHFYFSLLLIDTKTQFDVFEDATGMYCQGDRIYNNLIKRFPVHANIMLKQEMFSLNNKYVNRIWCDKKANSIHGLQYKMRNWNTVDSYMQLRIEQQNSIKYFFFKDEKCIDVEDAVIILTQNFVGLSSMSFNEMTIVYKKLYNVIGEKRKVIIKVHPDDKFDYKAIFVNALIINGAIPFEILQFLFVGNPYKILTFSSTTDLSWAKCQKVNFSKEYLNMYSYDNEFFSIMTILDFWRI